MKRVYKLSALILAVIIAAAGIFPAAADSDQAQSCIEEIIDFNLQKSSATSVQDWIDGELTENAGLGSEWYITALSKYGNYDFSSYRAALVEYLSKNEVGSASSRQKYALTLLAVGSSDSYINETLNSSIGEQGVMSLIFGLHLLNNGCKSDDYSLNKLVAELLSFQLDDGGWAVAGGNGDVDVTAMAIQALAPQYKNDTAVKISVDGALDFLTDRQQENGGYSSYGINNPESAAQVLIALSSLGIDAETDSRFIKNGNTVFDGINEFRLSDGSFCHKAGGDFNSTATVQVFNAMVAYCSMKNGKDGLYIFKSADTVQKEEITEKPTEENLTLQEETTTAKDEITVVAKTESHSVESETVIQVSASDDENTARQNENQNQKVGYKLWAVLIIAVLAVASCAVLFAAKKRRFKDYLIVILIAAAGMVFVLLTNFESAESHYNAEIQKENAIGTVSISIRCDTVKDKNGKYIPADGVILEKTVFEIEADDTVYDILSEACAKNKIHLETKGGADSAYVEGINNIYEMDFGDLSGWMYFVNGDSPSVSCGEFKLKDGDEIEWYYTCEIGKDLPQTADESY